MTTPHRELAAEKITLKKMLSRISAKLFTMPATSRIVLIAANGGVRAFSRVSLGRPEGHGKEFRIDFFKESSSQEIKETGA